MFRVTQQKSSHHRGVQHIHDAQAMQAIWKLTCQRPCHDRSPIMPYQIDLFILQLVDQANDVIYQQECMAIRIIWLLLACFIIGVSYPCLQILLLFRPTFINVHLLKAKFWRNIYHKCMAFVLMIDESESRTEEGVALLILSNRLLTDLVQNKINQIMIHLICCVALHPMCRFGEEDQIAFLHIIHAGACHTVAECEILHAPHH